MREPAESNGQVPSWQQPLEDLERVFHDASRALAALRRALESPEATQEAEPETESNAAFERLWQRLDSEKLRPGAEPSKELNERLHGLELLPKRYLVTVEDRERPVDLVPLHRALLGLVKEDEIDLVSCANGTPVVSLRTTGELDPEVIGEAVANGMGQACEVIPQGDERIFLRLSTKPREESNDE